MNAFKRTFGFGIILLMGVAAAVALHVNADRDFARTPPARAALREHGRVARLRS